MKNTSPKNSRRGCLCADGKKYSKECCKGKLINQGIGNLNNQGSEVSNAQSGSNTVTNTSTDYQL